MDTFDIKNASFIRPRSNYSHRLWMKNERKSMNTVVVITSVKSTIRKGRLTDKIIYCWSKCFGKSQSYEFTIRSQWLTFTYIITMAIAYFSRSNLHFFEFLSYLYFYEWSSEENKILTMLSIRTRLGLFVKESILKPNHGYLL